MDVLGKMIGIRLFVILLLTFILMRIFYIYFYQYLELKYIHFPHIPGLEKKSSPSSPTSDLISSSSMNAQYGRNTSYHALRKSPKYNFFHQNNGSRINWQRNSSFVGSNRKKSSRISKKPLYEDWENRLKRQEVSWEDFVNFPRLPPRSKQNIPVTAMASLRRCEERKNDTSYNSTSITKKGCNDIWNDHQVKAWKSRKVKGLCDEKASSKVHCFDSVFKTRFCVFENTMLNFKKMRKRKQETTVTRVFEKGFLSTDCGEMSPEDINYYQLYSPDIEHRDDLPCDFVFNETVLLYSHDNIRNVGSMMSDYLNIWMMLSLSGLSRYSKDISLLNMDHFIPAHHHHRVSKGSEGAASGSLGLDQMNQFFKNYNISFRRIIKASEFMMTSSSTTPPPRVCVKRLLLPPKPLLSYHWNVKETHEPTNHYECPMILKSSLLQRWNLQIRNNYRLFSSDSSTSSIPTSSDLPSNSQMKILVLFRSPNYRSHSSSSSSRVIINADDIMARLQTIFASKITTVDITVEKVVDLLQMTYDEQVRVVHSASIIIAMNGAEVATSSIHMPIGTRYCCGVVEIFPDSGSANALKAGVGYSQLARRLGHVYQRMDVSGSSNSGNSTVSSKGSVIPLDRLEEIVMHVYQQIITSKGSCFLSDVLQTPYL